MKRAPLAAVVVLAAAAIGCETIPPTGGPHPVITYPCCPEQPMSSGECVERMREAMATGGSSRTPAELDPPLDFNGDGVIGGPDFVQCSNLSPINEGHRAYSCPPPTPAICRARYEAANGGPATRDPALDANGDGQLTPHDFVAVCVGGA